MAHFEYVGIDPFRGDLSRVMLGSMRNRILRGLDINDRPAPPLSRGYARAKQRRGARPVRDWYLTGQTLSSMSVIDRQGQLAVGLNNQLAAKKAAINNARVQQWGLSSFDRDHVIESINQIRGQLVRVA